MDTSWPHFSKENRPDPFVQLGLFFDAEGRPVSYRLFDGNVPDSSTLATVLAEFNQAFDCQRIVVVADKAMNTRPNLGALVQNGDGLTATEPSAVTGTRRTTARTCSKS